MATISQLNGDDLQAKKATYSPTSMYNIGEGDSYVENGDGTVTITRVWDGVTYTETVPENVPLNTLDANMSNIARDEIEKTLNLCAGIVSKNVQSTHTIFNIGTYPAGTYTIAVSGEGDDHAYLYSGGTNLGQIPQGARKTFPISSESSLSIDVYGAGDTIQVMLVSGNLGYPYQPYNGAIMHEIRSPLYFSTENVSPASIEQIGGDWTSLGSFSIGGNTVYAWRKA